MTTSITLQPLDAALLPSALELDQLCFGGLWTLDGYQKELDSPNSDLLAIVLAPPADETELTNADESQATSPKSNLPSIHPSAPSVTPSAATACLIGLGCSWAILDEAHITILGVHPSYQRRGLGHLMLCALLDRARHRQMARATLEVRISNQSALALYQKFEFQGAGRRKAYYTDTGEDALILWRGGLQTPQFSALLAAQWAETQHRLVWQDWALHLLLPVSIVQTSTLTCS
ncbi:ribosomal protein S18-alanine N-acetyltransferase [Myxacorys almedinensis]|uniref:ribosomal protein S18-alanine N-acetyltransferase n=1 Tax=Myxacorys almedinensis TaxID=2651157 RepID=UPI00308394C8